MKDEEFDLEMYRKAWQAEGERLLKASPILKEEQILDIIRQHDARRSRVVKLWKPRIVGIAATVLLLIGVAWMLQRFGEQPTAIPHNTANTVGTTTLPYVEEAPQTSVVEPSRLSAAVSLPSKWNRVLAEAKNSNEADHIVSIVPVESSPVFLTDSVSGFSEASLPTQFSHARQPEVKEKDYKAIRGSDNPQEIGKSGTWKNHSNKAKQGGNAQYVRGGNYLKGVPSIGLIGGLGFSSSDSLQKAVGLRVVLESESASKVCANTQASLMLTGKERLNRVCVDVGYGLTYRPVDNLSLRINMGIYMQSNNFDLGGRLNAEADCQITDQFMLGIGYRYSTAGIISSDSRHMPFISLEYVFD